MEEITYNQIAPNFLKNVDVICLLTEHQRSPGARFKGDRAFQVELEFRNVVF